MADTEVGHYGLQHGLDKSSPYRKRHGRQGHLNDGYKVKGQR